MHIPNLIIFYVKDPQKSAEFYEKIFEMKPVDSYPTWVTFTFNNGLCFGLWSTKAKDFLSEGNGHRSELSFMINNEQSVRDLYNKWIALGVTIEQKIHEAVFGVTFVALDPDGHRIRVCMPD